MLFALSFGLGGAVHAQKGPKPKVDNNGIHAKDAAKAAQAAEAMAASKNSGRVNALLDAMALGVRPKVARGALAGFAKTKPGSAFGTVVFYARHRNAGVRARALKTLVAYGGKSKAHVAKGLRDPSRAVRAVACSGVAELKLSALGKDLLVLLEKGDKAAAKALAAMATPELARALGEKIGKAPDDLLAEALGGALLRPGFKPDAARVEVVKVLGKLPGPTALEQLTTYVASIPETPPRESRKEAETIIEQKLGGGE